MDKKDIKVYIESNKMDDSENLKRSVKTVKEAVKEAGLTLSRKYDRTSDLIICVGGDGTFLNLVHELDFPSAPIIGVNTGHLGFFQEIEPDMMADFLKSYLSGDYKSQEMSCVDLEYVSGGKRYIETGLNEMVIRGVPGYNTHLKMSIGEGFMEIFTGDGILVATPAGSTAYNYSLGGSIVDPRLESLQVTPIAPMNTIAYRSFTSSLLLPPSSTLTLIPENESDRNVHLEFDGITMDKKDVSEMHIRISNQKIKLLRLDSYDFWGKVKSKFL